MACLEYFSASAGGGPESGLVVSREFCKFAEKRVGHGGLVIFNVTDSLEGMPP